MYTTTQMFRISKVLLVMIFGIFALLIFINNITDYYSNYFFVQHVLTMDTIFANSVLHYRSIKSPVLFHLAYIFIICLEGFMAFGCLKGGIQMMRQIRNESILFHMAKKWAVAGLLTGICIWLFGFEVVGGEWFAMWQSSAWNGLSAADRIALPLLLTLVFLHQKEIDF
jgi:predicted small integral membrane protein